MPLNLYEAFRSGQDSAKQINLTFALFKSFVCGFVKLLRNTILLKAACQFSDRQPNYIHFDTTRESFLHQLSACGLNLRCRKVEPSLGKQAVVFNLCHLQIFFQHWVDLVKFFFVCFF